MTLSIGCAALAIPVVWSFRDPQRQSRSAEVRYFSLLGTAARRVFHNARLRTLIALQAAVGPAMMRRLGIGSAEDMPGGLSRLVELLQVSRLGAL